MLLNLPEELKVSVFASPGPSEKASLAVIRKELPTLRNIYLVKNTCKRLAGPTPYYDSDNRYRYQARLIFWDFDSNLSPHSDQEDLVGRHNATRKS